VIVAVECHRACLKDDAVWLELLLLVTLMHLRHDPGMYAETRYLGDPARARLRLL
jgi:hypothetical protein